MNLNFTISRREALTFLAAAAGVACLSTRPGFSLAAGTALDTLLSLIGERLAVMPDVARHKYNSGAAVEDLPREAQVIEAVTLQAVEAGLDKDVAAKFFQAQIDASKMIQSERIAAWKAEAAAKAAGLDASLAVGSVVASDAFFPFADGLEAAAAAGATAVIQPGGSMRDAEVIAAADAAGLAMVFTGMRHFRH